MIEKHITVKMLNDFIKEDYYNSEIIVCEILEDVNFLPLGQEEEIVASQINMPYIVELRNGNFYVLLNFLNTLEGSIDTLVGITNCDEYMYLSSFSDDLSLGYWEGDEFIRNKEHDIMKVFQLNCPSHLLRVRKRNEIYQNLNLIWEREKIKEMTLEEIEEELGYKIIIK